MADSDRIRWSTRCVTCGNYLFAPGVVGVAFRLISAAPMPIPSTCLHRLEEVDLEGREPWVGIRVVCKQCVEFFKTVTP